MHHSPTTPFSPSPSMFRRTSSVASGARAILEQSLMRMRPTVTATTPKLEEDTDAR